MQISGINQFSLIEYPKHRACVIFTPSCNLRCHFCHNDEFVLPEKLKLIYKNLITEDAILKFLEKRKNMLNWVSICWGEPTLQKDLKEFCKKVKNLGYSIKLDTNGRDVNIIKELVEEKLLDYVAVDIKHAPSKFSEIVWLKIDEEEYYKTIKYLLDSDVDYEFRTTVIKWVHTKEDIEKIACFISWAKAFYLQNYRPEKTLNPDFKWDKFSQKELEELLNIWKKYIMNVWIRN